MLIYILLGAAVALAGGVLIVAMQPSHFRIERSASISAPADAVFDKVNDVRKFNEWSPWSKRDPNASMVFEGPPAGVGAAYMWSGNKQVGEGKMTLIESEPNQRVRFKLEFQKPFAATNFAEFVFTPQSSQTHVSWSMTGKSGLISKAFCMVMDMDKMVGADFERGLSQLKTGCENVSKNSAV